MTPSTSPQPEERDGEWQSTDITEGVVLSVIPEGGSERDRHTITAVNNGQARTYADELARMTGRPYRVEQRRFQVVHRRGPWSEVPS